VQDSPAGAKHLMGDELQTQSDSLDLTVVYQDADLIESEAVLRIHYYRENEVLNFSAVDDSHETLRVIRFQDGLPVLPSGKTEKSILADQTQYPNLLSGKVQQFKIPLEQGTQYIFVELIQTKDFDRILSAPIWVTKKALEGSPASK
jgi:hypothetical protein